MTSMKEQLFVFTHLGLFIDLSTTESKTTKNLVSHALTCNAELNLY